MTYTLKQVVFKIILIYIFILINYKCQTFKKPIPQISFASHKTLLFAEYYFDKNSTRITIFINDVPDQRPILRNN